MITSTSKITQLGIALVGKRIWQKMGNIIDSSRP
jgi:hypothetical protein